MSTAISWTNETWNPVVGCEAVSEGCDHCYAKALHDMRHKAFLAGKKMLPQYRVPFETVQTIEYRLDAPHHWRAPRRVFVNSVSDLFHRHVPEAFLDRVFRTMAETPRHTYQILTKRPHRMSAYMRRRDVLPNVWLGTSVEHQAAAALRIPQLLKTPAAVRFLSCEPLLGPIDFAPRSEALGFLSRYYTPGPDGQFDPTGSQPVRDRDTSKFPRLNWVIVGGESGPIRRELDLAWLRSIVEQCRRAGVAVFVKQDSASKSEQRGRIPDDLWIREYPAVPA